MVSRIIVILFHAILFAQESHAALDQDTTTWTNEEVLTWVDTQTFSLAIKTKLKDGLGKNGVVGNTLLHMNDDDFKDECGIDNENDIKKIQAAIKALVNTPAEQQAKMTYRELRSLNRKVIDYIQATLATSPRWSISLFKRLPENHCQPKIQIDWLQWLFVPEVWIWMHSHELLCGLPGFIPWVLLGNALVKVATIIGQLATGSFRNVGKSIGLEFVAEASLVESLPLYLQSFIQ